MSSGLDPLGRPDLDRDERPGLYVHVPFCSAICPYCDFAVRTGDAEAHRRFVDALLVEIATVRERLADSLEADARDDIECAFFTGDPETRFGTLYFGGGTPSALSADAIHRIVEALRRHLPVADDAELFLEANPEDVLADDGRAKLAGRAKLERLRALGVQFLSLGVQAFDDATLRFLGRRHTADDARRAVDAALEAGFDTVNVDLMYALPREAPGSREPDAWRSTLETALALGSQHLSLYELEIHERTVFGKLNRRGELLGMPEPQRAALFETTHETLRDAGWDHYEVSNAARAPAHRSRHNRKYWRHVPYLGLGPSAHSYAGRSRWWNERSTPRWQRLLEAGDPAVVGSERLTDEHLIVEAAMLGLRTTDGLDLERLRRLVGIDLLERHGETVDRWIDADLVRHEPGRLVPTLDGLAIADGLAVELLA